MGLSANGEPAIVKDENKVDVSFHLQPGSLIVNQDGNAFEAYHAAVEFVDVSDWPWLVDKVRVTAKGPDGKSVVLTVDLLNDTYDGPRAGVPAAIWKVVALAATTAGDVGITYSTPDPRPMQTSTDGSSDRLRTAVAALVLASGVDAPGSVQVTRGR